MHQGREDSIVVTVKSGAKIWTPVVFSRQAFTSVRSFDKQCPVSSWQWLGTDNDLRLLLPWILNEVEAKGLPVVKTVDAIGLHEYEGEWHFVTPTKTLSAQGMTSSYDGDICWKPHTREVQNINVTDDVFTAADLKWLVDVLPYLNEEGVIWPLIGWYAAAPLKVWLEKNKYRFPILNVTGTKGSGKTTMIQRLFMPLFGQPESKSYDANTTKFVSLALMGSTNAVPISFSEFRTDGVEHFQRFVLLSYDTGHDPRGRSDQTVVDYPLCAPFSVDGEDILSDPACRERIVVAQLSPSTVLQNTPAHSLWYTNRDALPKSFYSNYIKYLLGMLRSDKAKRTLLQAQKEVQVAFPSRLPDRVRNNHVVVWFGILLFSDFLNDPFPKNVNAKVLGKSIESLVSLETGYARVGGDNFIEWVVNQVALNSFVSRSMKTVYNPISNILWIQLSTCYDVWYTHSRRSGKSTLDIHAIRTQLKDASYYVNESAQAGILMHGIDLKKAAKILDTPSAIKQTVLILDSI